MLTTTFWSIPPIIITKIEIITWKKRLGYLELPNFHRIRLSWCNWWYLVKLMDPLLRETWRGTALESAQGSVSPSSSNAREFVSALCCWWCDLFFGSGFGCTTKGFLWCNSMRGSQTSFFNIFAKQTMMTFCFVDGVCFLWENCCLSIWLCNYVGNLAANSGEISFKMCNVRCGISVL